MGRIIQTFRRRFLVYVATPWMLLSLILGHSTPALSSPSGKSDAPSLFVTESVACRNTSGVYIAGDLRDGRFISLAAQLRAVRTALFTTAHDAAHPQLMKLRATYKVLKARTSLETSLCAAGPRLASQATLPTIRLSSTAFKNRGSIPTQYSCWTSGNRMSGAGISPPLQWSRIPPTADRLALLVYDQKDVVHWLIFIERRSTWFQAGLSSHIVDEQNRDIKNVEQVRNAFGIKGYSGPCPETGVKTRYSFSLLALKGSKGLSFGRDATTIKGNLKKFTLSSTTLGGYFTGLEAPATPTPRSQDATSTATPTITATTTPTVSPTETSTHTPTLTPSYTPQPTDTPTAIPTASDTPTLTPTFTNTPTPTPTSTDTPYSTPTPTPTWTTGPISSAEGITTSNGFSCALLTNGATRCWGDNTYGQLGDNTTTNRHVGTSVSGLPSGVTAIATGGSESQYTCAITTSGALKCWGNNPWGQIGDNTKGNTRLTPVDVTGLSAGVTQVSTGWNHTCAVVSPGGAKCWGRNTNGRVGDNSTTDRLTPVDVYGLTSGVSQVGTGWTHSCALLTSGAVKCWGSNTFGELGDSSYTPRTAPVSVSSLSSGVSQIAVGAYHTCALSTTGSVKCWGYNDYGQLGNGTYATSTSPVNVTGLASIAVHISAGHYHTCAVLDTGAVQCWGVNNYGQLGDSTTTTRNVPTNVSGLSSGAIQVSTGTDHSCARLSSGGVRCWGGNYAGQIGNGAIGTNQLTPISALTQ